MQHDFQAFFHLNQLENLGASYKSWLTSLSLSWRGGPGSPAPVCGWQRPVLPAPAQERLPLASLKLRIRQGQDSAPSSHLPFCTWRQPGSHCPTASLQAPEPSHEGLIG